MVRSDRAAALRSWLIEGQLGASISLGGFLFKRRTTAGEVIFYDWIADRGGAIRGLEIHLPPDDPSLKTLTPLEQMGHVDTGCFMRIWLTEQRGCSPLGREAFGDVYFFGAEDGRLAIVVGIDDWLSPVERDGLLTDLGFAGWEGDPDGGETGK